jgi:hypothetical protein
LVLVGEDVVEVDAEGPSRHLRDTTKELEDLVDTDHDGSQPTGGPWPRSAECWCVSVVFKKSDRAVPTRVAPVELGTVEAGFECGSLQVVIRAVP